MNSTEQELYNLVVKHLKNTYSPYSNFAVSAALKTKSGKIYTGTNIENASYGLSMCAERVCLFNYINDGSKDDPIETFIVTGNTTEPISPCGACRQVMAEFMDNQSQILLTNLSDDVKKTTIDELLPSHFNKKDLNNG